MLIFRGVNVLGGYFKKMPWKSFEKRRWFSKPPHMGYNFSGTCMALEDITFLDRLIWSRTHGKVVPCDKWNATLQGFRDEGPSFGKAYTSMNLSHDKFPVITFKFMLVWGTFAGICVAKRKTLVKLQPGQTHQKTMVDKMSTGILRVDFRSKNIICLNRINANNLHCLFQPKSQCSLRKRNRSILRAKCTPKNIYSK